MQKHQYACQTCGTEDNLIVHFGLNEQTGKYAFHLCSKCSDEEKAKKEAAGKAGERKQNIRNYIANTDY